MSERASAEARFRPDLEGLRAVAVGLVLLYHARVPGFAGGFAGVDVFFVLSGFLITGLLVRELSATGRVDLRVFYARRARRLLPAAALALGATVLASAVLLPPLRVPDVAADGAAAALYVSNLRFAAQATDYLAADLAPSPLLHFWSLGVEEQFYLAWPALLALVAGGAFGAGDHRRGRRRVTALVAGTLLGSLGLSIALTGVAAPWAFFSLPARAWELALGGLLALPIAARGLPPGPATVAGWAGVALIVLAGVTLGGEIPFPGTAALLPTAGAALVILAGLRKGTPASALTPARVLALAPFRYLGRISYSLYLWHWPLLVLPAAALERDLPGPARVGLVLLAIPVAAASQHWVEEPIRRGRFIGLATGRSLRLAVALTVSVAVASLTVGAFAGMPAVAGPVIGGTLDDVPLPAAATPWSVPSSSAVPPSGSPAAPAVPSPGTSWAPAPSSTLPATVAAPMPADLAPALRVARDDLPRIYRDGCHLDLATVDGGPCTYGSPAGNRTVVVFGDSHAAQWFPALERLATERGWRLVSLTKSACPSVDVTVWSGALQRSYAECDAWRARALARIRDLAPSLVVVTNSRDHRLLVDGVPTAPGSQEPAWAAGLGRTLAALREAAGAIVVLGDTPRAGVDPPICLSRHPEDTRACATFSGSALDPARVALERAAAAAVGARFVDVTPWVCPTDPCPVVVGRFLVYRDKHHLTATYARALAPRLEALLPLPN